MCVQGGSNAPYLHHPYASSKMTQRIAATQETVYRKAKEGIGDHDGRDAWPRKCNLLFGIDDDDDVLFGDPLSAAQVSAEGAFDRAEKHPCAAHGRAAPRVHAAIARAR